MKKTLILIILTYCVNVSAQNWSILGKITETLNINYEITHVCSDEIGNIYASAIIFGSRDIIVVKWNGSSWNKLGQTANKESKIYMQVTAMCVDKDNNIYVAYGSEGRGYNISKWNGIVWSEMSENSDDYLQSESVRNSNGKHRWIDNKITSLISDKLGNIYFGGNSKEVKYSEYDANKYGNYYYTKFIVEKWDGAQWSELGNLNADNEVQSLCTDETGNIYAACRFKHGGLSYVSKWDGLTWLKTGSEDENTSIIGGHISHLSVDKKGNIYSACSYTYYSGQKSYIAKWNGVEWTKLISNKPNDPSLNSSNVIMCIDTSGSLYISSDFNINADIIDGRIAKWNGANWSFIRNEAAHYICTDKVGNIYAVTNGVVVKRSIITTNNIKPKVKTQTKKPIQNETTASISLDCIGVYKGNQPKYYLKNQQGNAMIINGNKVQIPSSDFIFDIKENGIVAMVLINLEDYKNYEYTGSYKIISNTSTLIKLNCILSNGIGSKVNYTLEIDKATKSTKCFEKNSPMFDLNKIK